MLRERERERKKERERARRDKEGVVKCWASVLGEDRMQAVAWEGEL
jgi:hypothetical protein